jgi:lysylphosphatidylglycerol synthetase-like protein (DUF2156 family)
MPSKLIAGPEAKACGRHEKWVLLSPHLTRHGREALAYSTLQDGLEYFIDDTGYIAFTSVTHPVLARKTRRIVLSDPVCAPGDYEKLIRSFLANHPHAAFVVISEACAEVLRRLGFKVNCIGYEPELPIQTYNTQGNWKELDLIKRARNAAKREGILIREEQKIEKVDRAQLEALRMQWLTTKRVNDREIWIYARRPVFEYEEDVRKFVAYDRDGRVAGFAFYDPMYRDGRVYGYSAPIVRTDEQRFGRLVPALHMEAIDRFRPEGKEILNLCLAPFAKLTDGRFNDDFGSKLFFQLSERFGDDIYNFKGLNFHKSKYRGSEKSLYFASNRANPSMDVYLAFLSSDITRSYWVTLFRLLWGIVTASRK